LSLIKGLLPPDDAGGEGLQHKGNGKMKKSTFVFAEAFEGTTGFSILDVEILLWK
jgi:hypothetical protein